MGMFEVSVRVGNVAGGDSHDVDVLVDTGALHTVLPTELLQYLGIEPKTHRPVRFGDDRVEMWPLGEARIAYGEEEWVCPVYFSDAGKRLMGSTTLETFSLMVDPANQTLSPMPLDARPF